MGRTKGTQVTFTCDNGCGNTKTIPQYIYDTTEKHFCSQECSKAYRKTHGIKRKMTVHKSAGPKFRGYNIDKHPL